MVIIYKKYIKRREKMSKEDISNELMKLVKKAQVDEEEGAILYKFMAKIEKNEENKKILMEMSKDEKKHAEVWRKITKKNLKPSTFSILRFKFLNRTHMCPVFCYQDITIPKQTLLLIYKFC